MERNMAIASMVVKRLPWRCRMRSSSASRDLVFSRSCSRNLSAGLRTAADGLHGGAHAAEVLADRLLVLVEALHASVQGAQLLLLLSARVADLVEDVGQLLLVRALLLHLLVDGLERLTVGAVAIGNGLERLGQVREIAQQLILPPALLFEVVAHGRHQLGDRVEPVLEISDGRVSSGPGAQERAADGRLDAVLAVRVHERQIAVGTRASAEPVTDTRNESRLVVHDSHPCINCGFRKTSRRKPFARLV